MENNALEELLRRVAGLCQGYSALTQAEFKRKGYTPERNPLPVLSVRVGPKWVKIVSDNAAAGAFIDPANGDIYAVATFSRPAKHVRGNVFADDYRVSCMTPWGVKMLR
jgi:hypothetical protein